MTTLIGKIVLGLVAAIGVIVFTPRGTQEKIVAAVTHKPADAVDKAKAEEAKAVVVVEDNTAKVVHAAAIEADKTVKAAAQLPPSQTATVVQRTAGNTADLLQQVSPLLPAESQANTAIILGLLAEEKAKRIAAEQNLQLTEAELAAARQAKATAEAQQATAEQSLAATSTKLTAAQKAQQAAAAVVEEKEGLLRTAFDKENALANELRVTILHRWALGIGLVLAAIAFLWVKFEMKGVGKSLQGFESSLTPDKFHDFVAQLDDKLTPVGQYLVREGKIAAIAAEAKAKSLASGAKTQLATALAKPAGNNGVPAVAS